MIKINYETYILLFLIALLFSCHAPNSNLQEEYSEDDIFAQTQLVWDRLVIFDNDSSLYESPMRFYAMEFNILTDSLVKDIEMNNLDDGVIFNRMASLKNIANSTKINDSINEKIQNQLSIDYEEEMVAKEIKNRLLKANYLFTLQMATALERIKNQKDSIPYLIAHSNYILKNEEMFAVLVIPNRDLIEFITFDTEQDSIKFTSDSNHFIRVMAEPLSDNDSISATVKLQGIEPTVHLSKHFRVVQ